MSRRSIFLGRLLGKVGLLGLLLGLGLFYGCGGGGSTATPTTSTTTTTIGGGSTTTTTTLTTTTTIGGGSTTTTTTSTTTTTIGGGSTTTTTTSTTTTTIPTGSAGSLDAGSGFGNRTGTTTTSIGTVDDEANAVAIQSDGKLVVAGYSSDGNQNRFALVRYNATGSLDTSFGAGGIVTTAIGTVDDVANALVIQPDGKLVAAGYSNTGSSTNPIYAFAVVRYNTDGSLDATFGTGGIVTTLIGGNDDEANALVIQSDGKLVAAGFSDNVTLQQYQFAMARYNTNGSLDATFGGGGIVTTSIGTVDDEANALVIQSDGKLVAAGYSYNDTLSRYQFALARYNVNVSGQVDGSLDATFNSTGTTPGIVTTFFGTVDDEAFALAVQSDGKLVAAGYSLGATAYSFALARYTTTGSLDTAFSGDGKVTTPFGINDAEVFSLVIQPTDGKLVAAGYSFNSTLGQNVFTLVRYSTTGILDTTTFGTGGRATTAIGTADDEVRALAIQLDGKLVAAGYSLNTTLSQYEFALARYTTAGILDTAFAGGIATTAITTNGIDDEATALVIQPDGKLVAAGYTLGSAAYGFALARYTTAGSLDTSFSGDGKVTTFFGSGEAAAYALLIQPADGKLVAAGYSQNTLGQNVFTLVRYSTTGLLDTTFGAAGRVTTAIGTVDDEAFALAIQADGKLVAAGYSQNTLGQNVFALVRYNSNGSLDATFGAGGIVTTPIGTVDDEAFALAIQTDGKLVVAGYSNTGSLADPIDVFAIVRYNTDGSLDTTTFGTVGIVTTAIGVNHDVANALVIQADGKLVAAGYTNDGSQNRFALVRYNSNGSLDTTFNPTGGMPGIVTTLIGSDDVANALVIQADGKLVAAGYSLTSTLGQNVFALARYNVNVSGQVDGSLDTNFGAGGIVTTLIGGDDAANALAIQADGKLVAAGYSFDDTLGQYVFALARYNP